MAINSRKALLDLSKKDEHFCHLTEQQNQKPDTQHNSLQPETVFLQSIFKHLTQFTFNCCKTVFQQLLLRSYFTGNLVLFPSQIYLISHNLLSLFYYISHLMQQLFSPMLTVKIP